MCNIIFDATEFSILLNQSVQSFFVWRLRFLLLRFFAFVLLGAFFLGTLQLPLFAWQQVSLAWNPSPDSNVVSYTVYFGLDGSYYSQAIPVGDALETPIYGLAPGATYHFAVSASDADGNESPLSEEVTFTVPQPKPVELKTEMYQDDSGQPFAMAITGNNGKNGWWSLEFSTDLLEWQPYAYGFDADVFALVWIRDETEPQMFFRLISF
jgi:hypothetical protein